MRSFTKKGITYTVLVVIVILPLVLTTIFMKMEAKKSSLMEKELGETQFELLQTYQRGEKALLYIDQAAKYSMQYAVFDLFENGGYISSGCGEYNGYNLWQDEESECYPTSDSLIENYPHFVDENINYYLGAFPEKGIPFSNYYYDCRISGDNISLIALAYKSMVFDVKIPMYEELDKVPGSEKPGEQGSQVPNPPPSGSGSSTNPGQPNISPKEPSDAGSAQKEPTIITQYKVPSSAKDAMQKIVDTYTSKVAESVKYLNPQPSESLVFAVIMQESKGDPEAISSTGCAGLMQFCYDTALKGYSDIFTKLTKCGCSGKSLSCSCNPSNDDRFDSDKAIEAGTRYLSENIGHYAKYTDRERFALVEYNAGAKVLENVMQRVKKEDPTWEDLASELKYSDIEYRHSDGSDWSKKEKQKKVSEIKTYVDRISAYKKAFEDMDKDIDAGTAGDLASGSGSGTSLTGAAVLGSALDETAYNDLSAAYAIRPSFKQSIRFAMISRFSAMKSSALDAILSIKRCLAEGSSTPDDTNDLETCSKVAGSIVSGSEDDDNLFYIFFKVEEPAPDELLIRKPLIAKFAVLLKDDIAPPLVSGISVDSANNNLSWDVSFASDTQFYNIYCSEQEVFDVASMKKVFPTYLPRQSTDMMLTHCGSMDDDANLLNPAKTYYLAVTAVDEAGNEKEEVKELAKINPKGQSSQQPLQSRPLFSKK